MCVCTYIYAYVHENHQELQVARWQALPLQVLLVSPLNLINIVAVKPARCVSSEEVSNFVYLQVCTLVIYYHNVHRVEWFPLSPDESSLYDPTF